MEIQATLNTSADQSAETMDGLEDLDHTLEQLEDEVLDGETTSLMVNKRFDLCPACYREFLKNPFGREKSVPFGFSHN